MRLVADPRNRPKARRVFSPSNSVVEFIAGPFVECVERIWEAKLGEYLSASDARRHLWHACLASGLPTFRPRSAAAAKRSYDRLTYAPGKELAAQAYGECPLRPTAVAGTAWGRAAPPRIYQALVQILQRGGPSAKAVMHSDQLSDELIRAFATLPTAMASKRAIDLSYAAISARVIWRRSDGRCRGSVN